MIQNTDAVQDIILNDIQEEMANEGNEETTTKNGNDSE